MDVKVKNEPPDILERKDPTSFLPEEAMSYEIKKKKKKKKRRQQDQDPFKDIGEIVTTEQDRKPELEPGMSLDPEVTIKVENIEVELDFNDFTYNEEFFGHQSEESQEHEVKLEQQNKEAVLLTFESIINDGNSLEGNENIAGPNQPNEEVTTVSTPLVCKLCHLLFKNNKTLKMHQKRQHKIYRKQRYKFICHECEMAYEHKSSLVAHMRRRHGPNVDNDVQERACEVCSLVFKGMNRLRLHMRRKHEAFKESFTYVCKDCGITYDKSSSLQVHRRRKHSVVKKEILAEWITCPHCFRKFDKRETYARHMQRNHIIKDGKEIMPKIKEEMKSYTNTAGEVTCKECPLVFASLTYLKLHMRRKHNALKDDFRLNCRICNLSYNKIESLKRHIQRKHGEGSYCNVCNKQFDTRELYLNHSHIKIIKECSVCGMIFASRSGLSKHMRCTHKIDMPKVVFCNICNEGFYDKRRLKPHLLRVHYKMIYTCKYCKKVFRCKESYKRHIIVKHNESTNPAEELQCEKCTKTFTDEFDLCRHVNTAHRESDTNPEIKTEIKEENENPFRCTKCSDVYSSWDQLRTHYEQNHYRKVTCICQICGQEVQESELKKHIKLSHTPDEELQCRFCDFKTKVRATMTQHMLRHKDATTLTCDYLNCPYKTFYVSAMEKHKRKHQEQGVKYQCTQCPFQTMNKYILRYHEEAHETGKKRYNCDKCEYATNLPANLIQHKYKHSTVKRFKCELCPFATKYNTSLRFHVKKKHCDLPS